MNKIKLALIQMHVTNDKAQNLDQAEKLIKKAATEKADIVVLPEMFNTPYQNEYFPQFAEVCPGETTDRLSKIAKENKIYLVGGSIPEREGEKLFNASFIFDKNGHIIGRHRKMHLFDIDIVNGIRFKESDTLSAGNEVTVCDTEFGKIGIAICFDMRFPELMRLMVDDGAKLIIVPAAFNMVTGPAHWHMTAKMRAVDNQVYFCIASPARNEQASYVAYGHSIVCGPWGNIVAELDEKENVLITEIDLTEVDKYREQLPLLKARRHDIYVLEERKKRRTAKEAKEAKS